MNKKITIYYELSNDMEIRFSPEVKELEKYNSGKDLKNIIKKYLFEIDNQFNLNGKILKAGKLEFEIENQKIKKTNLK